MDQDATALALSVQTLPLPGTPLLIEDLPEAALFYCRASSGWGLAKCMAFLKYIDSLVMEYGHFSYSFHMLL